MDAHTDAAQARRLRVLGIAHTLMFVGGLVMLVGSIQGQAHWLFQVFAVFVLVWSVVGYGWELRKSRRHRSAPPSETE